MFAFPAATDNLDGDDQGQHCLSSRSCFEPFVEALEVQMDFQSVCVSCRHLRGRHGFSKHTSDRVSGSKNLDEERRRAIGQNTLDIEVAVPSRIKEGHLDLVRHPGIHIKSPVVTQPVFKPKGVYVFR